MRWILYFCQSDARDTDTSRGTLVGREDSNSTPAVLLPRRWKYQPVRVGNLSACLIGEDESRENAELSKITRLVFFFMFFEIWHSWQKAIPVVLKRLAFSRDRSFPIRGALGFPARSGW